MVTTVLNDRIVRKPGKADSRPTTCVYEVGLKKRPAVRVQVWDRNMRELTLALRWNDRWLERTLGG